MIKERPILMQGWGVRATLDDRKSQTRRLITLREFGPSDTKGYDWHFRDSRALWNDVSNERLLEKYCPYGRPGDLLYFRETWRIHGWGRQVADHTKCFIDIEYKADSKIKTTIQIEPDIYEKYWKQSSEDAGDKADWDDGESPCRWRPSIFMPKRAARIWRRIINIRAQRVQDISEADAQTEGIEFRGGYWLAGIHPIKGTLQCWPTAKMAFPRVWNSINAKPKLSHCNPWTLSPEDCYVSYPWDDILETRQHRSLAWYVIGNPFCWAITSEKADQ